MSDDQYSELEKEDCTKSVLDNADVSNKCMHIPFMYIILMYMYIYIDVHVILSK